MKKGLKWRHWHSGNIIIDYKKNNTDNDEGEKMKRDDTKTGEIRPSIILLLWAGIPIQDGNGHNIPMGYFTDIILCSGRFSRINFSFYHITLPDLLRWSNVETQLKAKQWPPPETYLYMYNIYTVHTRTISIYYSPLFHFRLPARWFSIPFNRPRNNPFHHGSLLHHSQPTRFTPPDNA